MLCGAFAAAWVGCTSRPSSTGPTLSPTTTSSSVPPTTSSTESTTTTSSTIPDAIDPVALLPIVQDLVDRHEAAVALILTDPRVAEDETDPAILEYRSLFSPTSDFPDGAIASWRTEAAAGRFYRPGPAGAMAASTVQEVTPDGANEAALFVCTERSVIVVDGSGAVVSSEGGRSAGTIRVRQEAGRWLLVDLSVAPANRCESPG